MGNRLSMRGTTLIELMTVIVVLAILSTFAVSTYRTQLIRTNRTDGRQLLLRVQVAEEKFFLQNNTYTIDLANPPPTGLGLAATSPGGFYTLVVAPGATGTIASSFQVTATAAGTQVNDLAGCLVLTIDNQGQRTPNDATGCWK
jgi:type IV pilus assembly protein PilE